jgi:hypothetical protein
MRRFSAVAAVLGGVMPVVAGAAELKPMQAGTFVLRDQTASVYYTQSGDTFEVVTTIGPTDGSGAPVRLTGFLLPGQKQMVSIGAYGRATPPQELELVHSGKVLVAQPTAEKLASR